MEATKMIVNYKYDENMIRIECEEEELQLIKEFANTITIPTLQNEKIIFPILLGIEEIDGLKCEPLISIESYPLLSNRICIYFQVNSMKLTYGEKQDYKRRERI